MAARQKCSKEKETRSRSKGEGEGENQARDVYTVKRMSRKMTQRKQSRLNERKKKVEKMMEQGCGVENQRKTSTWLISARKFEIRRLLVYVFSRVWARRYLITRHLVNWIPRLYRETLLAFWDIWWIAVGIFTRGTCARLNGDSCTFLTRARRNFHASLLPERHVGHVDLRPLAKYARTTDRSIIHPNRKTGKKYRSLGMRRSMICKNEAIKVNRGCFWFRSGSE